MWMKSTAMPSRPPITPSSSSRARIGEDGFIADSSLDAWVRGGEAVRAGSLLTSSDGRRYVLRDAVRILGRCNGDTDPYGFTGRVEAVRDLIREGAIAF